MTQAITITNIRTFLFFGLGVSLALSISLSLIFGALLVLFWIAECIKQKDSFSWKKSPLDVPIVVYFLWGVVVSLVLGSASLRKAASTQSALLLFFLLVHGTKQKEIPVLLKGLILGAAVAGLWGILQCVLGINFNPSDIVYYVPEKLRELPKSVIALLSVRDGRAVGPRSHPLTYVETFIPIFFLVITLLYLQIRKDFSTKRTILLGVSLVLIVSGLILGQGRAVWMGIFVGTLVFAWAFPLKGRLLLFAGMGVFVVAVCAVSPGLKNRALSIVSSKKGSSHDKDSRTLRFYIWDEAAKTIKKSPLVGVGLKGVALEVDSRGIIENRTWSEAHNSYLQIVLERGVIGFGMFLWILFVVFRLLLNLPPPWRYAGFGTLVAFLLTGLTESWVNDKEIAMLFWAFVGVSEYFRREHQMEKHQ